MSELEKRLIRKAEEKHGKIKPVKGKGKHDKRSFTRFNNKLYFWFNDEKNSTHIIKEEV